MREVFIISFIIMWLCIVYCIIKIGNLEIKLQKLKEWKEK